MTTATPTALPPEPLLLTVPAAAKMLSISARSIYNIIARGDIHLRHVGRSRRIHVDDLRRYADSLGAGKAVRS